MAYQNGLTTAAHDAMDVGDYMKIVMQKSATHRGGLIVDVFSGGGRDIQAIRDNLGGDGHFAAIDSDPLRIHDMVSKDGFTAVYSATELCEAFERANIAVIDGQFPDRPYGLTGAALVGQADFVLCNAGIMFVPPDQLQQTLHGLTAMLSPTGEMVLRFSQDRADQAAKLGTTYFVHAPETVTSILETEGFSVRRSDDLPDPAGRGFHWVDLHISQ
jgi:hypothetical protein